MNVLAIVQARMSSSRLPGKVLKPILGEPMVIRQLERVAKASHIDHLMLATSDQESDDQLASYVETKGYEVFRGSLNDVLGRYYKAASLHQPNHVVRLTADCPLIDHEVIDDVIRCHIDGDYDYTSNIGENLTFPDGLDTEIVKYDVLKKMARFAKKSPEREHVTQYIRTQPANFNIGSVEHSINYSALRWTVDQPEDFEFVTAVYGKLYEENPDFLMPDILKLLELQPEVSQINKNIMRNEGLKKEG